MSAEKTGVKPEFYFVFCVVVVLALVGPLAAVSCPLGLETVQNKVTCANKDLALEAVKLMKDWGVWMAPRSRSGFPVHLAL